MNYSDFHIWLMNHYSVKNNRVFDIENTGMQIHSCSFDSFMQIDMIKPASGDQFGIFYESEDLARSNLHFSYPVIKPHSPNCNKEAIILLHGLNERSWDKYLTWGYQLAENTGKSVILFPIAFHMNRSPEMWNSPRLMNSFVSDRQKILPGTSELTFANMALSERLTSQPQRFFLSGYQAATDLIQLIDSMHDGIHPLFDKRVKIDFFGYSIGVMLSQVLLLANPGNRFDDSRFFFFCGGSVLEGMRGISKYILDSAAFERIIHFYGEEVDENKRRAGFFEDLLHSTAMGNAFLNLTSYKRLKNAGKKLFRKISDQVVTIALKQDKIIPEEQIQKTMQGTRVETWDFDYEYSHEMPFPVRSLIRSKVDYAFKKLFGRAGMTFA